MNIHFMNMLSLKIVSLNRKIEKFKIQIKKGKLYEILRNYDKFMRFLSIILNIDIIIGMKSLKK